MADPVDIGANIDAVAQQPSAITTEVATTTLQSLPDLIEADKYRKTGQAANQAHRGLRITRIIPPGANGF